MTLRDSAHPLRHAVEVTDPKAPGSPELGAFGLPSHYSPRVAGYASGPFILPETVTPTDWRWNNQRTYVVRCADDQTDYRALLITVAGKPYGYWAVERLGEPLTPFTEETHND